MNFSEFGTFELQTRSYKTLGNAQTAVAKAIQSNPSLTGIRSFIHAQFVEKDGNTETRFYPVLLPRDAVQLQNCINTALRVGFVIYKA